MSKKVLFVITKSVWGGAQRYVYDLATSLPASGFQPIIAAGGQGMLFEKLEKAGIKTVKIPWLERDVNAVKEIASLYFLYKIFKAEQPDIIHLNSSKTGAIGALAAYGLWLMAYGKPKIIFTVHGWAFNEDRNFFAKIGIFLSQWITAMLCDSVIVLSRHDYRQALKLPLVPKERFAIIPLGISLPEDYFLTKQRSRAALSKMLGEKINADDKVIGTIGELTKNKGLDYLIMAVSELKSKIERLKVIIIGDGEDRFKLREQINSAGLANAVYLTGFVPEASRHLKSFEAFLMPSLKEGLPYVVLEAMSAGLPISATSAGGLADLVNHGESGFLTSPKNHHGFASAIERVLKEIKPTRARKIHSEKLLNKFSLAKMIDDTITVYLA